MEVPPLTILPGEDGKEEEVYPGRRSPGGVGGEKGDRTVGGGHGLRGTPALFVFSLSYAFF